jgi:Tol biopolymer transport system component
VVLCELEGVSRKDAALRLGIREGTLSSRLASARKALADRLRQRGVVLSASGLSAVFVQSTTAAPPAALAARAMAATTPELVPHAVGILSHGVLRIMFLDKLKTAALLVAMTFGMAALAVLTASATQANSHPPPTPRTERLLLAASGESASAAVDPEPLPRGPNKLLLFRSGKLILLDPDGKNEKRLSEDDKLYHPGGAMLSPDGKQLAWLVPDPLPPDDGTNTAKRRTATLHVRGIDEKEPGTSLGVACQLFVWSGDGTEILCCDFEDGTDKKTPDASHVIINVKSKEKTPVNLPADHIAFDWSRDGKFFLTTRVAGGPDNPAAMSARQYLMKRDGAEHKVLTDDKQLAILGRFSPDGTRVLFGQMPTPEPDSRKHPCRELVVLDIATGKQSKVEGVPIDAEVQGYCWSPDGKRIAYTWRQLHGGDPKAAIDRETESHLVVCDPGGKNQKTILSEKGQGQWHVTLASVDWR